MQYAVCSMQPTLFAPGRHASPVAKEALGGVVPLQHVTVSTLGKGGQLLTGAGLDTS